MRYLLLTLALVLLPAHAEPLRLEAQVGVCEYGIAPDGIWWSSYYPTDIDKRTTCYQLGASQSPWKYKDWALGWRAAYVDLGKLRADNQFTYLEPQQPGLSGEDCDVRTSEGCRARGQITQKTKGVTLGLLAERKVGDFTLGTEGGAYLYRSVFEINVTSYPDPSTLPPSNQKWASRRMTGYYGATARYGYLFATGRIYSNIRATEEYCQECGGITGGKTWQATVGIQVPW